MRRGIFGLGALAMTLVAALVTATVVLSRSKLEGALESAASGAFEIAPIDRAVTLARLDDSQRRRVVIVTRASPEGLDVVPLEAAFGRVFDDAIEAFSILGYEALASAAARAPTEHVAFRDLGLPFDPAASHVAAGTNFREHAEEVGREEGPFLFPKLSRATSWDADVPDRTRLDYEAELCGVTLTAHSAARPARLGFVLCNDFTDRWTLVREMDFDAPMGTTGFPDGKGGDGMLPVGALLVIPRDASSFHVALELELYVDGALRQRARGGQMIWSPATILAQALAGCDVAYRSASGTVPLTECAAIPPRTLILTGTPGGVLFHPVTLWSKRAYLEPGDEVVTRATHLGILRNRVR